MYTKFHDDDDAEQWVAHCPPTKVTRGMLKVRMLATYKDKDQDKEVHHRRERTTKTHAAIGAAAQLVEECGRGGEGRSGSSNHHKGSKQGGAVTSLLGIRNTMASSVASALALAAWPVRQSPVSADAYWYQPTVGAGVIWP